MTNPDRTGYVYVLHFDTKLCHAAHYVGCTTEPFRRLRQHALGRGSNLCRVLRDRGINWELSGLYQCSLVEMRKLERQFKNSHDGSRYCELCEISPVRPPGTKPISIDAVPFPRTSRSLAGMYEPLQLRVRLAEEGDDLGAVKRLMGLERHALGFIPVGDGPDGLNYAVRRGRVILAEIDLELVGFLVYTLSADELVLKIQQTVTLDPFRGSGVGRAMVEFAAGRHPKSVLSCWVRDDLAANGFWTAIGFERRSGKHHKTSGSWLNNYVRLPATGQTVHPPQV